MSSFKLMERMHKAAVEEWRKPFTGMHVDTKDGVATAKLAYVLRAALRAIKPEDVSDGMVEAYRQALYAERASDRTMTAGAERRALAAAIAAGAEQ